MYLVQKYLGYTYIGPFLGWVDGGEMWQEVDRRFSTLSLDAMREEVTALSKKEKGRYRIIDIYPYRDSGVSFEIGTK